MSWRLRQCGESKGGLGFDDAADLGGRAGKARHGAGGLLVDFVGNAAIAENEAGGRGGWVDAAGGANGAKPGVGGDGNEGL